MAQQRTKIIDGVYLVRYGNTAVVEDDINKMKWNLSVTAEEKTDDRGNKLGEYVYTLACANKYTKGLTKFALRGVIVSTLTSATVGSEQAMRESFYTTNICPQNRNNNAGDWKDLEELARNWAVTFGSIYICCGPIVTDTLTMIGTARRIVVPQSFYKVFLRQKADGSWTSIGFIMPNAAGNRPLMTYMRSVDDVENVTGIDFFYNLSDDIEDEVEADYTISDWIVDNNKLN